MKSTTSPRHPASSANLRRHGLVICGAAALLFAGCASEPESHVVSAPPPPAPTATVMVNTAPAPTTATVIATPTSTPGVVMISQAPPSPQPEAVTARPSNDHQWVPGYWTWRNNRYEWMGGHWEIPPRAGATWVNPRWEAEAGAYRFYEGYWN